MGDNVSTDEILRAGAVVLPYRSNIPAISRWAFSVIDESYHDRAMETKESHGGHIVVAGENYAQGSSREHAAIAPKYLGQVAVVAKSYARIGWQNLVNFGVVPLEFKNHDDYERIDQGDIIRIEGLSEALEHNKPVVLVNETKDEEYPVTYEKLSERQKTIVRMGGVINYFKQKNIHTKEEEERPIR